MWFRIYPKQDKFNVTQWWNYRNIENNGKSMNIYFSTKDNDRTEGFIVTDFVCWSQLSRIIRSSIKFQTIKAERFDINPISLLLKGEYDKVKTIGFLKVLP
jgi:hypothetical protein